MTTAREMIQDALEMLRIYAPGEDANQPDVARGLSVLNAMLDEWAAQNIYVQQFVALNVPVVALVSQYTIGESTATIPTDRPASILYGPSAATLVISSVPYNVDVVSKIEYQSQAAYLPIPSIPTTLWYDPTFPNGTINLLPVPSQTGTLTCYPLYRLESFTTPDTPFLVSVGVYQAIRNSMAIVLKSYFKNAQLDQDIAMETPVSMQFLRYQSQNSRALFGRYRLATNPAKAQ